MEVIRNKSEVWLNGILVTIDKSKYRAFSIPSGISPSTSKRKLYEDKRDNLVRQLEQ